MMNHMNLAEELDVRRRLLGKKNFNKTIQCPVDDKKHLGIGITSDYSPLDCPFESLKSKVSQDSIDKGGERNTRIEIINSQESYENQINAMIQGGVSAASYEFAAKATYMNKANRESKYVYFNVFDSIKSGKKLVLQSEKLKEMAKNFIEKQDYSTFLSVYGTHYVAGIISQAIFFGQLQIHSQKSQDRTKASLAVSGSYSGAFKANGKAQVSLQLKQSMSNFGSSCYMTIIGADVDKKGPSDLNQLGESYQIFIQQYSDKLKSKQVMGKQCVFICKPFYPLFLSFPNYDIDKINDAYKKLDENIQKQIIKDLLESINMGRYLRACVIIQIYPQPQQMRKQLQQLYKESQNDKNIQAKLQDLATYLKGYSGACFNAAKNLFSEIIKKVGQAGIDQGYWYQICSYKDQNFKWSVMGQQDMPIRLYNNSSKPQQDLFYEKFGFKTVEHDKMLYKKIFYVGQPQKCLQSKGQGFNIVDESDSSAQIFKFEEIRVKFGQNAEDDVSYVISPQSNPFNCIAIQSDAQIQDGINVVLKPKIGEAEGNNNTHKWKLKKCQKRQIK